MGDTDGPAHLEVALGLALREVGEALVRIGDVLVEAGAGPTAEASDQPSLVPVLTVAPRLGLSKPKLYKLIAEGAFPFDGTLPVVQIGERKMVRPRDLAAFLAGGE